MSVVVFVTGMSGVGKSATLAELARRGHTVVDTDYDGWSVEVPAPREPSGREQLWNEERIDRLLAAHEAGTLFIGGCVANQGRFYDRFDAVVLLSAPVDVLLKRVAERDTNPYGKSAAEREEITLYAATVEPLLRAGAHVEIDTRQPLSDVVARLERVAAESRTRGASDRDY